MHFYTADPHFFHQNILKYCARPFRSVEDMNRAILNSYRSTVGPNDDLWILGDVAVVHIDTAGQLTSMLHEIPGRKHLVCGNHDKPWVRGLDIWTSVHDLVEIRDQETRVMLCHYPMLTWAGARRGAIQVFGHVHNQWLGSRNSVNVGVDCWDFRPVTLPEILKRASGLPVNPLWSKVEPRTEI